ncbi:hypothetical protein F8M41_009270 [Gigaspora margarita]|uniref:Uncharacterized protein n=1 Tax=Gigaspora margarita TaxID=4874 RepID=A0A8H4EW74_GIGMA|nr:hypothetical protein F8M41_009270 [Gigaspora margarita]
MYLSSIMVEMINNNLLNSNKLDLNDTVYFESEMTIPLDYTDTYNNSVLSKDNYHDTSNYYNNSVHSDDNNYITTQLYNLVDNDDLDNDGTDDELHLELVVGISFHAGTLLKLGLIVLHCKKGLTIKLE